MDSGRSASAYRAFLAEYLPGHRVAGPELFPSGPSISELEWQSRWFAGEFGREFVTTTGEPVAIVQFGWWNRGAGPDFRDCVVTIAGETRRGSIELDREARDWERHGHASNPAYEDTVLHLFLADRGTGRFFTRTASHRLVPQVLLVPPQSEAARRAVAPAIPGRCVAALRAMPEDRLRALLQSAARHRLDRKARRLRTVAAIHGDDQALYQAVAGALGYSRNQLPMTVLAQRLPVNWLRRHAPDPGAFLFGTAGFLEGGVFDHSDPATRAWLRGLWDSWWKHRDTGPAGCPRVPITWNLSGTRPQNHPQRRVAALECIVRRWPEFRRLLDPKSFDERRVRAYFRSLSHPYWDRHYTLRAAPAARREALAGSSRIADILANVIYPWLIPENPAIWENYCRLPAGQPNERIRRAAIRLFHDHPGLPDLTARLWQQQALLEIYDDFCLADESDCAVCPMPEQAARGGGG